MAKPYFLSQRNSIWYVFFCDEQGKVISKKSTGTDKKFLAQRKAAEWLVNGVPQKEKAEKETEDLDFLKLAKDLSSAELTDSQLEKLMSILANNGYVESFVPAKAPSAQNFADFCHDFWDWEKSPYIKEKQLYKHSIHQYYVKRNAGYVELHIRPFFGNRSLGSITKKDVKEFMMNLSQKDLSAQSINQITRVATVALKWAYNNDLTKNNCFDGLTFVAVRSKKREVLTMEEASAVFASEWPNEVSRLANLTAMCTGLRAGEIRGLMLQDIGIDRIYVRHSWGRGSEGLKTPKNGEEREVPILPELRDLLLAQAAKNPYDEGLKGFVFFSVLPKIPMDDKPWLRDLRKVLKDIGYEDPERICFHAWRHFYSARMADLIDQRKLQRATGHKTAAMLEHYADHAKEQDFVELSKTARLLFEPIVETNKF